MANHRMFSNSVISSDRFLNLPPRAQMLYIHLGLNADDDGFTNRIQSIRRSTDATPEDLKQLVDAGYVYVFQSGIAVDLFWNVNNSIRRDRYKPTIYKEEMQLLFSTHYEGQNTEIRRAFAMTCLTGIRRCDIVRLKYSDVDYSNRVLTFRQSKTEGHSSKSGVTTPLNDALLSLIGTKPDDAPDDYIFHLPSETMCLKALRSWTKKAGIDKHITWHCGRHSFATALLNHDAGLESVRLLLGHESLETTEIYTHTTFEQLKRIYNESHPRD